MTKEQTEQRADEALRETEAYRVPVDIEVLAHRLKLTTEAAALGTNVSGMLVVNSGRGAIAYNSDHAPVRQRFTVAHEVAHFLLHVKPSETSQLFIDRYVAFRRDEQSAAGTDYQEVEANQLGAALLMPEKLVREEIQRHDLDLDDEDDIERLAKRFQVSVAAMTNRLNTLKLLM